jgi:hypothetical protein
MPDRCEMVLVRAGRLGWAVRSERDAWVLARAADAIAVADVYKAFAIDPAAWGVGEEDLKLSLADYAAKEKK